MKNRLRPALKDLALKDLALGNLALGNLALGNRHSLALLYLAAAPSWTRTQHGRPMSLCAGE